MEPRQITFQAASAAASQVVNDGSRYVFISYLRSTLFVLDRNGLKAHGKILECTRIRKTSVLCCCWKREGKIGQYRKNERAW